MSPKPRLTRAFVANALGLPVPSDGEKAFAGVCTDSRGIRPGELFVALKGDRFDGHAFVDDVVRRGAGGILAENDRLPDGSEGLALYGVDDTVSAFRRLAGAWRNLFTVPVIAVAGAVGKTTTKELLAAMLRGRWPRLLKTEGSRNGFLGIPMTLLQLHPDDGAAVIEIGIDAPGAMERHLELVRPTVSLVTAIAEEHLEQLGDLATVAKEESRALTWVGENGGTALINADDPFLLPLAQHSALRSAAAYGFGPPPAGMMAERYLSGNLDDGGRRLDVTGLGVAGAGFLLPMGGRHNGANLLAALAAGFSLGLTEGELHAGLSTFKAPPGRSGLVTLSDGTKVLCDYYNASPASMRAGLAMLKELETGGTKWACLADMRELGKEELRYHGELVDAVMDSGAGAVLLYGPLMVALFDALTKRGFKGRLAHYAEVEPLIRECLAAVKAGDGILIKGSHSMRMERVFEALENRGTP